MFWELWLPLVITGVLLAGVLWLVWPEISRKGWH
jgi:hypothetical protein